MGANLADPGVALSSADAAEQQLVAAHKALLATKGLQLNFETFEPPKPPPEWLVTLLKALAPITPYILWTGAALGAALLVWLIIREVTDQLPQRRRRQAAAAPLDWRPSETAARLLLEDADRLAAEGRFDAAIRMLLHRSIEDLGGRRPGAVRPALTSRDIAALSAMPQAAGEAFLRIAAAVERTFFGGREADADAFAACRRDYEAFAFAENWR